MRLVQKLNGMTALDVLEDEHVSFLDPCLGRGSGRQFEGGDGVPGASHAPGHKPVPDAHDGPVAVEEDDVDRKAHEEHVHRRRRVDEHPGPGLETVTPEKAAHPG